MSTQKIHNLRGQMKAGGEDLDLGTRVERKDQDHGIETGGKEKDQDHKIEREVGEKDQITGIDKDLDRGTTQDLHAG